MEGAKESSVPFLLAGATAWSGVFGFRKAGSVPSLVAGLGFGSLFGLSAYLQYSRDTRKVGQMTGFVSSGLLAWVMVQRYLKVQKPFPPLAIAGVGGVSTYHHGAKLFGRGKKTVSDAQAPKSGDQLEK